MNYYLVNINVDKPIQSINEDENSRITTECNTLLGKTKNVIFCTNASDSLVAFCCVVVDEEEYKEAKDKILEYLKSKYTKVSISEENEIVLKDVHQMVSDIQTTYSINSMIRRKLRDVNAWDVGVGRLGRLFDYNEDFINPLCREKMGEEKLKGLATYETLQEELTRIDSSKTQKVIGHPVHYFVSAEDGFELGKTYEVLLSAIYNKNRIKNTRYAIVRVYCDRDLDNSALNAIYQTNVGGSVVLDLCDPRFNIDGINSVITDVVANLCKVIEKYKDSVLTIVGFEQKRPRIIKEFYDNLSLINVVEIEESVYDKDKALKYLTNLAKNKNMRIDNNLKALLKNDSYARDNLVEIFNVWYKNKMKNTIYPEYKTSQKEAKRMIEEEAVGKAYQDLNELVGLSNVKTLLDKIVKYYKFNKIIKPQGFDSEPLAMNLLFTGAPGTCKTTVARLLGKILRDNHILDRGHFVECGRSDLVGKYVGWTAKIVREKFKEAEGGVLFIDEAYSLNDSAGEGSYGIEAINTIVQEIENRRGSLVVIFAGYSDEMYKFIKANPGLQSRINFTVEFNDYNADELCDIAKIIAKKSHYTLSDEALDKMHKHFEVICKQPDFGNGRYVRNVIEQAEINHASRMISLTSKSNNDDMESLILCEQDDLNGTSDLMLITDQDVEFKTVEEKQRRIGF